MSDIVTSTAAPVVTAPIPPPSGVVEVSTSNGTPAVELTKEAGTPEKPVERLTPKFVELTRRERKLAEESKAVKESAEKAKAYEAARTRVKEDPFAALDVLGLTLDQLVEAAVKRDKPETVESKVDRLESERKAERVAAERSKQEAEQQAVNQQVAAVRTSVHEYVGANAEKYELVAAQGAEEQVFEVMVTEYERSGQFVTVEQASEMVEDYLLDRAIDLAKKSKKLGSALAPKAVEPVVKAQAAKPSSSTHAWFTPKPKATPTLTNAMGASPAPKGPLNETREQALARVKKTHFGQ